MSDIPDAAIEAAAHAIFTYAYDAPRAEGMEWFRNEARNAIEAAMPAIREHIAQEIESFVDAGPFDGWHDMKRDAARIVRGGTP